MTWIRAQIQIAQLDSPLRELHSRLASEQPLESPIATFETDFDGLGLFP